MNKNKFIAGLLLVAQVIGFTSCNDWLELNPNDTIAKEDYWKSKEDVEKALTGIYMTLRAPMKDILLWGEVRADMMVPGSAIDQAWGYIRRGELEPSNSYCSWTSVYLCINNCNLLLRFIDNAYANDASFTEELYNNYSAQAKAVRALLYFNLVRTFRDVPFALEGYTDNSQYLFMAKSSGDDILNFLTEELEQIIADGDIPVRYSYTDPAQNKGYMTRYAVLALLSDIYLWQNNYEKCITHCNEILNSGQFALVNVEKSMEVTEDLSDTLYYASQAAIATYFDALFVNGNSSESIFEVQYDDENVNSFFSNFVSSNCTMRPNIEHIPDLFPSLSTGALEMWDNRPADLREGTASKLGYIWKWAAPYYDSTTPRSLTSDMDNNQIVYRLAQIYLMKAEALCQLGGETNLKEAQDLVYQIAERSAATRTSYIDYVTDGADGITAELTATDLETLILNEYAREFMFEGKRWFDVIRHAKRTGKEHYLMQIVPYSVITDKTFVVQNKYKNQDSWYMPLPKDDIQRNTLLKQNPFYDTEKK